MPTTIKTVSPFFNDTTAPPPFPPMLTDQLELFGNNHHSSGLLVDEALLSENEKPAPAVKADLKRPQKPILTPNFRITVAPPLNLTHAFSPYPKKTPKQFHNHTPSESESEQLLASLLDNEPTSSTLSKDSKIPKLPGEPGQPERGSYNLETVLDWNHKIYQCTSTDFTKVLEAFPDLEGYSNCWPVNNMIMIHLKYTVPPAVLGVRNWRWQLKRGKKSSASIMLFLANDYDSMINETQAGHLIVHAILDKSSIHAHNNPMSLRDTIRGLLLNLYDGAWIVGLTQRELNSLEAIQEGFNWMMIAVT
ncbi:hypothetical protein HD554DRAFT_2038311 [Boletus coccyginus]|nr:hypothetical protein HD554DRAFT_2038311 [Boletus coccyginus]